MSISHAAEATPCQRACATNYMLMVMYSTGGFLKMPAQCSYS